MQSIAVIVTRIPESAASSSTCRYHGATLSSFTSLTLHPEPLVAFSLRLPSRMADYLRIQNPIQPDLPHHADGSNPNSGEADVHPALSSLPILTVSLLSSSSEPIAHALARPQTDHSDTFTTHDWNTDDPPSIRDSIGCLRCEVVSSVRLGDLARSTGTERAEGQDYGSELFICRVQSVTKGKSEAAGKPLLHWRQKYISVDEG
jgi:flavin reductase (DIM6/NTAB) family NADH-FMN oxidoreductase RutF